MSIDPDRAPHGVVAAQVAESGSTVTERVAAERQSSRATTPSNAAPVAVPARCRIASEDLFVGVADELEIQHGVWVYRLRRTAQGKLILTK